MFNRKLKRQVAQLQTTVNQQQQIIKYSAVGMGAMGLVSVGTAIAAWRISKTMSINSRYVAGELSKMQNAIGSFDEDFDDDEESV